ncbi:MULTISPECIES: ATP-dependent Clp protease adaptor ClpS [Clostridium]|uniref:ATP-dependent Clp protease adapter protein ClpS n=2 Tax=Clostridium TaxID=1485 RepID=A0A151AMT5_9CLOT|nr:MULTISPECIES: ATP-dependent Clp protease adaptor ClpS [Clostridium]KYH28944.1 ATP-dependent Clp protease adapter protein ClpS [Clostridium colicanis DSM 13634]PRR73210.1 ATP-dependent Clp protease adapter protein ClpS [Clostridium thermopalmarium DSM 5974]PVZ25225.1 ATP-dependent Clp protease adaptor protein ClpS [Clostridium thermopalmarium DSM 5974]
MNEVIFTKEKTEIKIKKPNMYKVLLHNDDYTTMDFVVEILIKIFRKSPIEAERIMFDVHRKGIGIAGIYSYDIASTKIRQVMIMAEENGFPLKLTLEKE